MPGHGGTGSVVGRGSELGAIRAFLDRPVEAARGFVLEGEPGIGKSTLWYAGVARAREKELCVLVSRPAEAELGLAHVGLGDLFEGVLDDVLPVLPAPRRRALEVALLREEAASDTVDPRALGIATRAALQFLAERKPVVVAIDDLQWLDDASAHALAFALRRLRDDRILLFVARRDGHVAAAPLEEALDVERVERLSVAPLSVGALHGLLVARLGHLFARPTLLHLHETSGGNPFYALELARAVDAEGTSTDPTAPLRIPESLERLVLERLRELSDATREALSVVAIGGRSSPAMLRAAGVDETALAPAFVARVIERTDGVIRFTHPLLASALYQELPYDVRERAHRALAVAVSDPLARARHLALASSEPDADVAAEVAHAAAVAASRGASVTAAELAEHALRLTSDDEREDRRLRAIEAARLHVFAGNRSRARAVAEQLLANAANGVQRAEALVLLSDVEATRSRERAVELRREAVSEAGSDPALRSAIHRWLGDVVRASEGVRVAEQHARASLELAERVDDDGLRAGALALLGVLRFNAGQPDAVEFAEQGHALAAAIDDRADRLKAELGVIHVLTWSAQHERARALLESLYEELSERNEPASSDVLWFLSLVELGAGRFELAADYAERQREISRLYAVEDDESPLAIWIVARVAAHRGELDRARALAERSRALAQKQPQVLAGQEGVLGLVAAWSEKPRAAVAHFAAAEEGRHGSGIRGPSMYWWRADYVEALLALGRIEAASSLLGRWEDDAARLGLPAVLAQVTRCHGLVAAATADVDAAAALLERAAVQSDATGDPFGRARALLALGKIRRRGRKKRLARDAIETAAELFEATGASGWAAAARAELGRIGGRTREEGLTAAERRVAALVAEGRTNREVAAALFLGERTVETHLSHVYAKLGVRSRAELARVFRSGEQSSGGLTIST